GTCSQGLHREEPGQSGAQDRISRRRNLPRFATETSCGTPPEKGYHGIDRRIACQPDLRYRRCAWCTAARHRIRLRRYREKASRSSLTISSTKFKNDLTI